MSEALEKHLIELWRDRETEKAIAAADRGEFASQEEVEAVSNKWSKRLQDANSLEQ